MAGKQEAQNFVEELHWCINQLELGLQNQSPNSRQAEESLKVLKILRSQKAPMVKKRQVMRNTFGDYRKKMREAEKKSISGLRHSRFQHTGKMSTNSRFLKLSHSKQQGSDLVRTDLNSILDSLHLLSDAPQLDSLPGNAGSSPSRSPDFESLKLSETNVQASTSQHKGLCVLENQYVQSLNDLNTSVSALSREQPSPSSVGLKVSSASSVEEGRVDEKNHLGNPGSEKQSLTSSVCGEDFRTNGFKFEPSDNAFMFAFNDPEKVEDSAAVDVCPQNEATSSNLNPNLFKYVKSGNDFSFNFDDVCDD